MDNCIRKSLAEFFGTFTLVFFGVGAALYATGYGYDLVCCALAFGLTVMVMSVTVGKISGCHLNPAISIAMFLDKKLSVKDLIGYIIFQIIGAIVAGLLLTVIMMGIHDLSFGDTMKYWMGGANSLAGVNDTAWIGLLVEIILTMFFVLVVFGATSKNSGAINGGLYIGLALTMVHIVGINLTGTSVNPARSIGLAIFVDGAFSDLWVFIVAPIIGGILAWVVWKFILSGESFPEESAQESSE